MIKEGTRNYVNMQVNPCKMCMPMGASQALKGFRKTMNIIHGSQGCSTYIRRHMAAHYNEPVDIASSSLSEEGTVYGGSKNLKIGISNLVSMYQPEIVGVLTTCLAETIGDDIERIVKEVRELDMFDEVDIIPIPTPGYGGSQSEGYFAAIKGILKYYSTHRFEKKYEKPNREEDEEYVNIVVSNATCEDIREIKRLLSILKIKGIILPDISDVLDAPYTEDYQKLSDKGCGRDDILRTFEAKATIELGDLVADIYSPGLYLEEEHGISCYRMPLPIGIRQTDQFIETLMKVFHIEMPEELIRERGRLIDGMIDSHKHGALGKTAIFGDMDLVKGISALMFENGVNVKVAATGSTTKRFNVQMNGLAKSYGKSLRILQDSDFETIREVIKEEGVNLMIGNSDGKFIWEKDGIDLIRVGFPVHDHIGAQRKLRFAYRGSMRLLDEVINKLLDQKHSNYKENMMNAYFYQKGMIKEETLWQL